MKNVVGIGFLVVFAIALRLGILRVVNADIYVHDTYHVIPLRVVSFWLLIGIAVMWFLVVAFKFARHGF